MQISINFRWLSSAKEAKILFFVPDINGEKFLPAHATREIFLSYLSPRLRGFPPFMVLSPAWCKLLFPLEHWCLGVAAIKNHTPPVFCCVMWLLSGTKTLFYTCIKKSEQLRHSATLYFSTNALSKFIRRKRTETISSAIGAYVRGMGLLTMSYRLAYQILRST